MEDTLRYFFSAIFQGIAAILTLGSMFYMNYNDKTKTRIKELEKEVYEFFRPDSKQRNDVIQSNIIEVIIKVFSLPKYENEIFLRHNLIAEEYLLIVRKQNEIKKILPAIILQGIILLISSAFGLFNVGYNETFNDILYWMGMIVLLFTFLFLMNLLKLIIRTVDIRSLKFKHLFSKE